MRTTWFESAALSVLNLLGEGFMWMGLMWMGPPYGMTPVPPGVTARTARTTGGTPGPVTGPGDGREHREQPSGPPLSRAERAEWAALQERLR
ncbi:hypothetical protein ACIBCB_30790 [Streptomyces uncialis]|uniref:hypothetical protein n=1 Tax=Streptomyces uncialis TaxID=1048205 RepID=UPI0037A629DB|nr:hypothetical protein OG268_13910 [Streptomyces uncialis]